MFASDDTMLASFGNAKLWPGYLHFGNESKYRRGRSSLKLLEEVAYFEFVRASLDLNPYLTSHSMFTSCLILSVTGTSRNLAKIQLERTS